MWSLSYNEQGCIDEMTITGSEVLVVGRCVQRNMRISVLVDWLIIDSAGFILCIKCLNDLPMIRSGGG